jgi:hypothetical protein
LNSIKSKEESLKRSNSRSVVSNLSQTDDFSFEPSDLNARLTPLPKNPEEIKKEKVQTDFSALKTNTEINEHSVSDSSGSIPNFRTVEYTGDAKRSRNTSKNKSQQG